MKIAIIADTHDNLANFKKAMDWIKKEKIKTVIHCGDVCAPAVLREAAKDFPGKIHLVFGNVDGDRFLMAKQVHEKVIPNVILYGEQGEIEIDGKKIAFVHFPNFAKGLAATQKYDLVFYGHTHKPWLVRRSSESEGGQEKIGKCQLVNPGNLAGLFYKPTFAIYDTKTDKLELKILEKIK